MWVQRHELKPYNIKNTQIQTNQTLKPRTDVSRITQITLIRVKHAKNKKSRLKGFKEPRSTIPEYWLMN